MGANYLCDRGSTHILFQRDILQEEYEALGLSAPSFDQRIVEREIEEYDQADAILVPSEFVRRSFVSRGIPETKLIKIPYGSNLKMFYPSDERNNASFDILFVGALSVRKGLLYLFQAFEKLKAKNKTLTLIGAPTSDLEILTPFIPRENVRFLGVVPQPKLRYHMSKAHVLVVPSIEEGLALVMGEALACGCPVLATRNTGAEDLFHDGEEGLIIDARDSTALTEALAKLHSDPKLHRRMSQQARKRIETLGGWSEYGAKIMDALKALQR
ncbi:glycosyltransferase family 4 protein [Bradyrhizobium sp. ERR14]|uniref:glycosyltransferase family 4 protein n=1 Tax=Bradyrhizobium sp. ERR14 TaxID=2663837 RepID=UPI001621DEAE|nr:glycosyltransferase family 4 protein [Bradyrhizobium sp. ERR14]MBB4396206.1 glycosyltransferase involved in cell wall biosynthesis [Bradyrhizobium sp. ERR14]